jgi:DNA polymerase-3 subunit gamma/tau
MRGATPPRLILELICGQMMIPSGDDAALAARVEKLERAFSITTPLASKVIVEEKSAPVTKAVPTTITNAELKVEAKPVVVESVKSGPIKPSGAIDITALRRMWPEVIENVKKRRRLTWSLLSTSAQILALDDESITIGIVNAGARDSFVRSESDAILSDSFEEVTGVRRKIMATVDTSVTTTTMARDDEDPNDANMLSGTDLLARELGAQVIRESN